MNPFMRTFLFRNFRDLQHATELSLEVEAELVLAAVTSADRAKSGVPNLTACCSAVGKVLVQHNIHNIQHSEWLSTWLVMKTKSNTSDEYNHNGADRLQLITFASHH